MKIIVIGFAILLILLVVYRILKGIVVYFMPWENCFRIAKYGDGKYWFERIDYWWGWNRFVDVTGSSRSFYTLKFNTDDSHNRSFDTLEDILKAWREALDHTNHQKLKRTCVYTYKPGNLENNLDDLYKRYGKAKYLNDVKNLQDIELELEEMEKKKKIEILNYDFIR